MVRLAFVCDECGTTNLIKEGVPKDDILGTVVTCSGCDDDVLLTE